MYKYINCIMIVLTTVNLSFSDPVKIISPTAPSFSDIQHNPEFGPQYILINSMNFKNEKNVIDVSYADIIDSLIGCNQDLFIPCVRTIIWDIENNVTTGIYDGQFDVNYINPVIGHNINDNMNLFFSAYINDSTVSFYMPKYFGYLSSIYDIKYVRLKDNLLVSGIVYCVGGEGCGAVYSYFPVIWDAKKGDILYVCTYLFNDYLSNVPLNLLYSPNGKFVIYHGIRYHSNVLDNYFNIIKNLTPYTQNRIVPDVEMIYLGDDQTDPSKWYDIFNVNKDVAFTKDDQFLVTEWKGVPTLFHTSMLGWPLEQYPVPSFMTACTFSPDDKQVYIACEDNKIYVFNVNLSASTATWELY